MSGAHAFLAPSSASTWGPDGCPAFPRMAQAFPERDDTEEAREGEAAHWWLTEVMNYGDVSAGALAPNGYPITDEMVEGGQAMLRDVHDLAQRPGVLWATEQHVTMPEIHVNNWGRADYIAVDMTARVLYVFDFKYGHGYVDAFENWQLLDYAIGAARHFQAPIDRYWSFEFRIYQPRSFHADGLKMRPWRPSYDRVQEMALQLRSAAHAASDPNAPFSTGKHCAYCPARHACPALRQVGGFAVDLSKQGVPSTLSAYDAGLALATVQTARERLEDLETGLAAQIMAQIRAGDTTSGWEVYQGEGREKWTVPAAEVMALGEAFGKPLAKPADVITPAQARKLGIDATVISAYSERPKGEWKLRPLDSKSTRKAFQ